MVSEKPKKKDDGDEAIRRSESIRCKLDKNSAAFLQKLPTDNDDEDAFLYTKSLFTFFTRKVCSCFSTRKVCSRFFDAKSLFTFF